MPSSPNCGSGRCKVSDINHLVDHAADDYGGWGALITAQGRQAALAYLADPYHVTAIDVLQPAVVRITVTLTPDQIQAAIDEARHADTTH